MKHLQRVLIMGTGPASIQLAILLKKHLNSCIGIVGRESVRSEFFFTELKQNNLRVRASIQNEKHRQLEGECLVDQVFQGYETVTGDWNAIVVAVATDAYLEVLKRVKVELIKQAQCIILISPTLGSNSLIRHYMNEIQSEVEIISFSTYLGDTRWIHDKPSNHVLTTGVKRKVFIGSTHGTSSNVGILSSLYGQLGITLQIMNSPLDAETRNISLYVHPPLFMNEYALSIIFGATETQTPKFVYKLFPEGPVTQYLIRDMLAGWKEISGIIEKLNMQSVNLLMFMTDDTYPVRLESLSRQDIERFMELETIHQEYLLYIRYTSLLIDPFSEPDQEGKYFDFSAVPIRTIFINREGYWDIPRMPKEDYYRIKIVQGIARYVGISCPTLDKFIAAYEHKMESAVQARKGDLISASFTVQSFEEDLQMICSELARSR